MPNLVECKSCKHKVDKSAKTCPNCGADKPGITGKENLIGCLGIIVMSIIAVIWMNSCSDNETVPQSSVPISDQQNNVTTRLEDVVQLNDENLNQHIEALMDDYIDGFESLMNAYDEMKDRPREKFINWMNNEWEPEIDQKNEKYRLIIEKNRLYFSESNHHDLTRLFSSMHELKLISLDVMRSIKQANEQYLIDARSKLEENMIFFEDIANQYGIDK